MTNIFKRGTGSTWNPLRGAGVDFEAACGHVFIDPTGEPTGVGATVRPYMGEGMETTDVPRIDRVREVAEQQLGSIAAATGAVFEEN